MFFHRQRRTSPSARSGFSLLELTLVLALLVVIAAIVWPVFERPLASQRLRHGADKVRSEWTKTRIRAMTSGSPHVFRYQPLTNAFRVEVWQGAEAQLEAATAMVSDFGTSLEPALVTNGIGQRGLPDGVVFDVAQTQAEMRGMFVGADVAAPMQMGEVAWSEPIYFFPDGTTSNARLFLKNEHEFYVILDLRGLTGITTVSDVLTVEELPR